MPTYREWSARQLKRTYGFDVPQVFPDAIVIVTFECGGTGPFRSNCSMLDCQGLLKTSLPKAFASCLRMIEEDRFLTSLDSTIQTLMQSIFKCERVCCGEIPTGFRIKYEKPSVRSKTAAVHRSMWRKINNQCFQSHSEVGQNVTIQGRMRKRLLLTISFRRL
jgi:hypothetical protein